jgi:hypothetical protein
MTIRNPDGSEYQLGPLQQFDPCNPELSLFNEWDQEAIEIGGTPIEYYEVFIQSGTVDKTYMEDRGKLWSPVKVILYAYYDPIPSKNEMGVFGADGTDELMFELNYQDTLRRLKKVPTIGSRIFTPHKRENWVIMQRNVAEFKMWGELRLQLMCSRFQESLTTGEGKVTQREPDFKLNSIKDLQKGLDRPQS